MESLPAKRWKILACTLALSTSMASVSFVFGSQSISYVSYGIDRTSGDWEKSAITIINAIPPTARRFDVATKGVPCPTAEDRLLICIWIAFMEIAVVDEFQELEEWSVDGVKFTNKGLVNIDFFNQEINDGYLISVDWSERGDIYSTRPPGSFQFIFSETFGLISLIKTRVAFELLEGNQERKEPVTISSVYWAKQLPAFQKFRGQSKVPGENGDGAH